jgi:multidrug efflux pump subunit AcrB
VIAKRVLLTACVLWASSIVPCAAQDAMIRVRTLVPEASSSVIEDKVTAPLERALASISGLGAIMSSSEEGVSDIAVQVPQGRDVAGALRSVSRQVKRARGSLPKDARAPSVQVLQQPATVMRIRIGE